MMMMPPNTILEMQAFMHDELHGKHDQLELNELLAPIHESRLTRVVRTLLRHAPREITTYREGDRVDSGAV